MDTDMEIIRGMLTGQGPEAQSFMGSAGVERLEWVVVRVICIK